jgi:hypothetical protein
MEDEELPDLNSPLPSPKPTTAAAKRRRRQKTAEKKPKTVDTNESKVTEDQKRKIAAAVQKHSSIWSLLDPDHKNVDATRSAWEVVAKEVDLSGKNAFDYMII